MTYPKTWPDEDFPEGYRPHRTDREQIMDLKARVRELEEELRVERRSHTFHSGAECCARCGGDYTTDPEGCTPNSADAMVQAIHRLQSVVMLRALVLEMRGGAL